jgi:hypothetical protein
MAAFDAWLEVRGHGAGALFRRAVRGRRGGERQLVDEGVAGIRAIGQRRLAWPLSHHTTCVAPLSPRERDAGADLATVQKMVGHESVTTTAGYDRREDAAKRKAADRVHVPFFQWQTRVSSYRFSSRQHTLPKISTIGSGHHAGKKAPIWLPSKARSFVVRPHGRLQPYC